MANIVKCFDHPQVYIPIEAEDLPFHDAVGKKVTLFCGEVTINELRAAGDANGVIFTFIGVHGVVN